MSSFKDDATRALEILDKMFDDYQNSSDNVCAEYMWRYTGAKHAIEELIGQEISYEALTNHHFIV